MTAQELPWSARCRHLRRPKQRRVSILSFSGAHPLLSGGGRRCCCPRPSQTTPARASWRPVARLLKMAAQLPAAILGPFRRARPLASAYRLCWPPFSSLPLFRFWCPGSPWLPWARWSAPSGYLPVAWCAGSAPGALQTRVPVGAVPLRAPGLHALRRAAAAHRRPFSRWGAVPPLVVPSFRPGVVRCVAFQCGAPGGGTTALLVCQGQDKRAASGATLTAAQIGGSGGDTRPAGAGRRNSTRFESEVTPLCQTLSSWHSMISWRLQQRK